VQDVHTCAELVEPRTWHLIPRYLASYLRALPSPLAADCVNYWLASRDVVDLGVLVPQGGDGASLAAVTGPNYGRVWNADIARALVARFGDG
jgi:hypothetical protein